MKKKNYSLKIGVIGSYEDEYFDQGLKQIAFEVGRLIAKHNCILMVGCESAKIKKSGVIAAAKLGARHEGGFVVGVMPNIFNGFKPKDVDLTVYTGGEAGGIREVVLTSSCDAIIAIGGGAGTLCEMALSYHNHIPLVAIQNSGGTSTRFANQYLDYRIKHHKPVKGVKSAKEAVEEAIKLAKKYRSGSGLRLSDK